MTSQGRGGAFGAKSGLYRLGRSAVAKLVVVVKTVLGSDFGIYIGEFTTHFRHPILVVGLVVHWGLTNLDFHPWPLGRELTEHRMGSRDWLAPWMFRLWGKHLLTS